MTSTAGLALHTPSQLRALLAGVRTAAVVGAKPLGGPLPASTVPGSMVRQGWRVLPVGPVPEPLVGKAAGYAAPWVASLDQLHEPVDLVVFFRRAEAIDGHIDEVLRLRPRAAWLQLGIRNEAAAAAWRAAGIDVVQDRCVMIDLALL